ncbi:hypothetical protein AND_007966 [Anopheles darlingi]|uniref:Uncharacterized protein n=1 Tax=Anopheles darlingi TaxID=43151 RepID=W5J8Y0_ANODA|nr:hypothetical protein AND_007966 [Anopheles darlingi]
MAGEQEPARDVEHELALPLGEVRALADQRGRARVQDTVRDDPPEPVEDMALSAPLQWWVEPLQSQAQALVVLEGLAMLEELVRQDKQRHQSL